jgi:hypothetical protein
VCVVDSLANAFVVHPRDWVQISAQTEIIFIFCLCRIRISICRVLALEHYLLI